VLELPVFELIALGAVSFGVGFSGAASPGPLTVLVIREAARRGWWAGPMATLGHGVLELGVVVVLALGLAAYVDAESTAAAVIALAGGIILVWLGWRLARSVPSASLAHTVEVARSGAGRSVVRGATLQGVRTVAPLAALVSIANPYWVIWWATVGTKLTVDSLDSGAAGPGAIFIGHILSDLVWLTFVAIVVASGARWLGDRGYRWLLAGCAAFMLGIGAYFAATGVAWFL
jgi:threonine/homoserine/homoserine lactone efflux protein